MTSPGSPAAPSADDAPIHRARPTAGRRPRAGRSRSLWRGSRRPSPSRRVAVPLRRARLAPRRPRRAAARPRRPAGRGDRRLDVRRRPPRQRARPRCRRLRPAGRLRRRAVLAGRRSLRPRRRAASRASPRRPRSTRGAPRPPLRREPAPFVLAVLAAVAVGGILAANAWREIPGGWVSGGWNWSDFLVHVAIGQSIVEGNFPPEVPYFAASRSPTTGSPTSTGRSRRPLVGLARHPGLRRHQRDHGRRAGPRRLGAGAAPHREPPGRDDRHAPRPPRPAGWAGSGSSSTSGRASGTPWDLVQHAGLRQHLGRRAGRTSGSPRSWAPGSSPTGRPPSGCPGSWPSCCSFASRSAGGRPGWRWPASWPRSSRPSTSTSSRRPTCWSACTR